MSAREVERVAVVDKLTLSVGDGHQLHYDGAAEVAVDLSSASHGNYDGAHAGYVLVRLDVDDENWTGVEVDAAGGWWPVEGRAPADLVERAAEYLTTLAATLRRLEDAAG